ncbi:MAG TPA: YbfB/YjiJ family MFS transporter [Burkholderiaceae bacterium]|nr:YbfB/YjiJ family MFS transporter [Burkholderiaceae bacterium]
MKAALVPWALSGSAAVTVGFGRFGYALILPAMQSDLHLNYTQAGWLNTSNSLGYLLGSILTVLLVGRLGNRRLLVAGLLVTTAALLASGLTSHLLLLNTLRFLTGVASAWAFICGGVLASTLGARAMVIYFGGGGSGMLITGLTLPWLFEWAGAQAWPWAWAGMALVCTPISAAAIAATRYSIEPTTPDTRVSWPLRPCLPSFIGYFLFGLGYLVYMTFSVAWVRQHGSTTALPLAAITSVMWALLGAMCMLAPLVWRWLFNDRPDGLPMAITMATLAAGAALPLLLPSTAGVWLSAALVGVSVLMVPSAVTGFIKANLPAPAWGSALAVATTLFAVGQSVGPAAAGWISDLSGSLSAGLAVAALILLSGAVLALTQRPV